MSKVVIQSLGSGHDDAARLAARLGIPANAVDVHKFPDGELRITTAPAAPVTIVYASLDQPNEKLVALLLVCEALKRNGASRLVLMAPYMCYMRQDTAFHENEAISQRVIGRLLAATFDRIVTVDAHLHRTREIGQVFQGIEAENLSALPAIASHMRAQGLDQGTVIIGPDAESRQWVEVLARELGLQFQVARKSRLGDCSVEITFTDPGQIRGRPILLVDDIVSSGGTLKTCARSLQAAGAAYIEAIITHALFPASLVAELAASGIRRICSTHSVPHPTNAILLDEILVEALRAELARSPDVSSSKPGT
jgi:ribose-phosphate pyrophosphokinase